LKFNKCRKSKQKIEKLQADLHYLQENPAKTANTREEIQKFYCPKFDTKYRKK